MLLIGFYYKFYGVFWFVVMKKIVIKWCKCVFVVGSIFIGGCGINVEFFLFVSMFVFVLMVIVLFFYVVLFFDDKVYCIFFFFGYCVF